MRGLRFGAVLLAALALISAAAAQEKRVALVIGNSAYKEAPLKNPVNDARLVAAKLKDLGFHVIARENATRAQMAGAVGEFAGKLGGGAIALVYYAGHGIQSRGRNYLIPVDAELSAEADLRYHAIELAGLMEDIEQAQPRVNIVVLDACRNNPFERRMRGAARGLAAVDAARGSLIAYATAPGSVAADGDGANAPYTEELVKALAVPNLKAEEVFKRVTAAVEDRTKGTQTPWISSSLRGDFVFNLSVTVAPAVAAPGGTGVDRETVLWQSVERSNRPEEYELFLSQFPKGVYAPFARSRIDALKKGPQLAAAPAPSAVPAKPDMALDTIDKEFVAIQTARLREAPDVKSRQMGLMKEGDSVLVLGKVKGQPWYQVERKGEAPGYVSAALLEEAVTYRKRKAEEEKQAAAYVPPPSAATPSPKPSMPAVGVYPSPSGSSAAGQARDCPDCPEMVVIPGGSFTMGSPPGEEGRDDDEGPQHTVSVRSFSLGKYEVTRGEFAAFVRESGYSVGGDCYGYTGEKWEKSPGQDWRSPGFSQSEKDPVVCVHWDDAKAYVAWLSRKTGKSYRLPSEAEWEYAARGQTASARHWGEESRQACGYANVADRTGQRTFPKLTIHECDDGRVHTAPVGSYKENGFGLHDMLGNVWEWTEDCHNKSYDGSPRDGNAWTSGDCSRRVLRGGSWLHAPRDVRSANRLWSSTPGRGNYYGFRVAKTD